MTSPDRVPPELDAVLADHPDAEALAALWAELPRTAPPTVASESAAESLQRRDRAYARLSSRLGLAPAIGAVPTAPGSAAPRSTAPALWRRGWVRAAAIALVVGGAAVRQATPVSYSVATGAAPQTVTLADGSRIMLAGGSRLRHPRGFRAALALSSATRSVELEGDAFLEVAKDGRPFIVRTADATVRVLGTHFEVRAAHDGRGTQVAVEEGRVAVSGRDAAATAIELGAGNAAVIGADGIAERRRDRAPERIASWRSGGLAIEDEPIPAVLADLTRRYGVSITLSAPVERDANVTLHYPEAPELERVLADLAAARGLRWSRTSRGFTLAPEPPR